MKTVQTAAFRILTCVAILLFVFAAYVYADLGESEGAYCDSICSSGGMDYANCMNTCCLQKCAQSYSGPDYDACIAGCTITLALCDGAANQDKSCHGAPNGCMLNAGGGCWDGVTVGGKCSTKKGCTGCKCQQTVKNGLADCFCW